MGFLRRLEGFIGLLQRLFGMLVSGLVIYFTVVRGGSTVGVWGELVDVGSWLVRGIWHGVRHLRRPSELRTIPFSKLFNSEQSRCGGPVLGQMKKGC
jgi:hypothetical protein